MILSVEHIHQSVISKKMTNNSSNPKSTNMVQIKSICWKEVLHHISELGGPHFHWVHSLIEHIVERMPNLVMIMFSLGFQIQTRI